MRAYLRIDPNLADRKADYPDGAHRAYVDTLCFAEQQPKRGRFRNRKLLSVLLEKRARWISYLIQHGDLIELASGALYVDGWDEWQEGDVTVSERMKRLRSRAKGVTPSDTPPVTPPVTPPTVTVPSSGSGRHLAVGGDGAPLPNGDANGANAPGTTGSMMGWRPKASAADIRRQEEQEWTECAQCGVVGRRHSASGDHPFAPVQAARA